MRDAGAGRVPRWLALLLAVLLLASGCSTIRIVYNQADIILSWMAHDYFDLDTAQRQDFNARLDPLLAWHRREQLPEYIQFLGDIKKRSERPVTRDDAVWMVESAKARYRAIVAKGTPDAVDVLTTLTPHNIQALEKSFAKANQKFAREHKLSGTHDERRKARLERDLKRIREWAGTLTHAQEERIAALNDALPYTDHVRHQDRQRRQKEFIALLNLRTNKSEFARTLGPWLADWEKGRAPEVQHALNDNYEKRVAHYLEVDRMLTPQQRGHLQQKIQSYIDDLSALVIRRVAVE